MDDDEGSLCGSCRVRLTSGWYVCHHCSERMAADLLEIADRYARLSAAPAMEPGRYDRSGGGKPGSKPPARLDIVALRDFRSGQVEAHTWKDRGNVVHRESEHDTPSVLRAVYGWVEVICDLREFESRPDLTVDAATEWLMRQDDWIARWSAGGELVAQVRRLRNRLRSATGEPNPRPIGYCFRHVARPDDERERRIASKQHPDECEAPIFLPEQEAGDEHTPIVRCSSAHKHDYSGTDLLRLKVITEQKEEAC